MNFYRVKLTTCACLGLLPSLLSGAAVADVVVVVSSSSTVASLSRTQVVDIFLGKSTRFPDGSPAVPVDQAEGALARDQFYSSVAGRSAAQIKAFWSKIIFTGRGQPPRSVPNSIDARKFVVAHPNAIGYIDRSAVDASVRVLF